MRRLAIVVVVLLGARDATADAKAVELFADGERLYRAGEYIAAGDQFSAAYEREPDPAYVYNAAQAYRAGNACARAAAAYRTFLDAVPNPPEPDKLRRFIAEMDACTENQTLAPAPQRKAEPEPAPVVAPVPRRDDVQPGVDPGRTKRWLGIAIGLGGVVAVGTAVWFSLDARDLARRYDDACASATPEQPCDGAILVDLDRRGSRAETRAVVAYIAGGAALAGGATLYLLGRRERRDAALTVRPTSGGAMVTTRWNF